MKLKIGNFYPRIMNLYGDRGNTIALRYRLQARGVDCEMIDIGLGESHELADFDILFIGGAQDREQAIIYRDFLNKGTQLTKAVESGVVLLAICGGYQLLGKYFDPIQGKRIEGLGLLDLYTKGGERRMIGNIITETKIADKVYRLIGFENHSGQTFLEPGGNARPLGKVIVGSGNNGQDRKEGARFKNVFGTYLHGALLPKNPVLADYLLSLALQRKYGSGASLTPLDDTLENKARAAIEKRISG